MAAEDYRQIASVAQKRRNDALPTEYLISADKLAKLPKDLTRLSTDLAFFTHDEIQIINAEAEEILQKIRTRIWTSLEVTEAFCKAATMSQQLVRAHHLFPPLAYETLSQL